MRILVGPSYVIVNTPNVADFEAKIVLKHRFWGPKTRFLLERYGKVKATLNTGARIEYVKTLIGFPAKGRDIIGGSNGYQFRDDSAYYNALFRAERAK